MSSQQHKKAVHFGAGNIGRGFVACFLHNSGYEVIFADVNAEIVDQLNREPSYHVYEVGADGTTETTITNYRALNSKTHEADVIDAVATADLVTCSVGPNILRFIAPVIAKGIDRRSEDRAPLAVIACENAIGATDTLAGFDADAGLSVRLEKFYEWIVDRTPFAHPAAAADADADAGIAAVEPPAIHGVQWKRTVHDALQDRRIHDHVHRALEETADLITSKHGIDPDHQEAYVQKIVARISNPHLEDVVERVGRAPLRKLSRHERFVGPAAALAAQGKSCTYLLEAAEMAFRFQNVEGDDESHELAALMAGKEPADVVREVCGLRDDEALFPRMVDIVARVQADSMDD
ncbi:mannitol-1-phosphate dehydrogenase [Niveomyces insectorum RCEF 264]|uniref:Mannitol-1-phosphate dehydrogenase n=1 Tax=Niveomyces insectorum RCEF 264 TaxID=1081102 RepID=A0A162JCC1_9HYPO|nr:mannitol-1-phosphate dehydrogenase [Niveomyces insectorum RCEF 264]